MNYKEYLSDSFNSETGELDMDKASELISQRKEKISILLLGATGVGKSTLINAVFGNTAVKAGSGEPVTQHLEKINVPEKGLILWDTKGIEAKDYENTRTQLIEDIDQGIKQAAQSGNEYEMPQVAWLCIKETSERVEEREEDLLGLMRDNGIPTVVVFTKTQGENGDDFVQEAKDILNQEFGGFLQDRYVRVNSESYFFMGIKVPVSGLDQLLEATEQCWLKEGMELSKQRILAFRQAQIVNKRERLAAMVKSAKNKVHIAAVAAGTAGASPIPFSDAPIIAGIQSTMIYSINSEFELNTKDNYMTTVITGILGMTAVASIGKTLVTSALKFIPGAGTLAGGAISATVATSITEALGHAYIAILEKYFNLETGQVELPEEASTLLSMLEQQYTLMKK